MITRRQLFGYLPAVLALPLVAVLPTQTVPHVQHPQWRVRWRKIENLDMASTPIDHIWQNAVMKERAQLIREYDI